MPRKTRKHKLDASHRRVLLTPKHRDTMISPVVEPGYENIPSQDLPKTETKLLPKMPKIILTPYLTHDLSKSLILAFIIISLQVGVFIAEKAGYIDIISLFTF